MSGARTRGPLGAVEMAQQLTPQSGSDRPIWSGAGLSYRLSLQTVDSRHGGAGQVRATAIETEHRTSITLLHHRKAGRRYLPQPEGVAYTSETSPRTQSVAEAAFEGKLA